MTDVLLTEPRDLGELVPRDTYQQGQPSHPPSPVENSPARLLFAADRQRSVAETLQSIIFKGGILSLLTLTIYRFWMKTDQRRLIWRETRLDGDGFEYTGTPLELLVGSMIAIVILAFWFGVANLGLSFLQLAAWQNYDLSILLFPILVSPLVAFAVYRARRYKLLRTKWRGIRFGMDGSAIKYAGRWLLWTIFQILTLGFLTPHKHMALERVMTTHMLYGDARFEFQPPNRALRHLTAHWMLPWLTGIILAGLILLGFYNAEGFGEGFFGSLDAQAEQTGQDPLALKIQALLGMALIPLLLVYPFYLRYKSREIATILSSRKLHSAYFESHLTWGATFKPFAAYCGYWLLLIVPIFIVLGLVMFFALSIATMIDGGEFRSFSEQIVKGSFSNLGSQIVFYGGIYFFYGGMILFSLWLAALIHFRRLHTYICRGTVVHNLHSVDQIKQRLQDDQTESEGFADALDIGGL